MTQNNGEFNGKPGNNGEAKPANEKAESQDGPINGHGIHVNDFQSAKDHAQISANGSANPQTVINSHSTPVIVPGDRGRIVKSEIIIERHAIRRWNVSNELRAKVRDKMETIVSSPEASPREIVAASKVLAQIDGIDVHREALEIAERTSELDRATSVIRDSLKSPAAREALSGLSKRLQKPQDESKE